MRVIASVCLSAGGLVGTPATANADSPDLHDCYAWQPTFFYRPVFGILFKVQNEFGVTCILKQTMEPPEAVFAWGTLTATPGSTDGFGVANCTRSMQPDCRQASGRTTEVWYYPYTIAACVRGTSNGHADRGDSDVATAEAGPGCAICPPGDQCTRAAPGREQ